MHKAFRDGFEKSAAPVTRLLGTATGPTPTGVMVGAVKTTSNAADRQAFNAQRVAKQKASGTLPPAASAPAPAPAPTSAPQQAPGVGFLDAAKNKLNEATQWVKSKMPQGNSTPKTAPAPAPAATPAPAQQSVRQSRKRQHVNAQHQQNQQQATGNMNPTLKKTLPYLGAAGIAGTVGYMAGGGPGPSGQQPQTGGYQYY